MVSIIVPAYNCEKELEKQINSICRQTFSDWELLLIDDGSTDGTGAICDEAARKEERIRVFHQKNQGVSSARNLGLAEAKGDYIKFADADDVCKPDMLEKMVEAIERTQADLVISGFEFQERENVSFRMPPESKCCLLQDLNREIPDLFSSRILQPLFNKLFRKDKIYMQFDTSLNLGEDLCFILKYLEHCQSIALVAEVLYLYHYVSSGSLTNQYRKNAVDIRLFLYNRSRNFCKRYFETMNGFSQMAEITLKMVLKAMGAYLCFSEDSAKQKRQQMQSWVMDDRLQDVVCHCKKLTFPQRIGAVYIAKKQLFPLSTVCKLQYRKKMGRRTEK